MGGDIKLGEDIKIYQFQYSDAYCDWFVMENRVNRMVVLNQIFIQDNLIFESVF
jgi:hypothetical protein